MYGQYLPSRPFHTYGSLRGLTGDVKRLTRGQTSLIIDVEYEAPRALYLTGRSSDASQPVSWTISTGLDRSSLTSEQVTFVSLSRIVIARSVQVIVALDAGAVATEVIASAAVIPVELSADAAIAAGLEITRPTTDANAGFSPLPIVQSIVPVFIDSLIPPTVLEAFGPTRRRGFTFYNNALSNAFILFGGTVAVSPTFFSVRVGPLGYFEAPYSYSGRASIVWAVAGAGNGQLTLLTYDETEGF